MHIFFDTVLKLHIGEIPEKPPHYLSELGLKRYSESFNHSNPRQSYEIDLNKYNAAIAAIKQNALTVWNSQIIPRVGNDGFEIFKLDGNFHKWPGGYETLKTLHCDEYHQHTKNSCFTTVAILTLPLAVHSKILLNVL